MAAFHRFTIKVHNVEEILMELHTYLLFINLNTLISRCQQEFKYSYFEHFPQRKGQHDNYMFTWRTWSPNVPPILSFSPLNYLTPPGQYFTQLDKFNSSNTRSQFFEYEKGKSVLVISKFSNNLMDLFVTLKSLSSIGSCVSITIYDRLLSKFLRGSILRSLLLNLQNLLNLRCVTSFKQFQCKFK